MEELRPDEVQLTYEKQTLALLQAGVALAASAREGSFAERNPLLGKMVRCPYCRNRRRQNAQESCCSAKVGTEYWSKILADGTRELRQRTEVKSLTPKVKGRKNPRLTRHRPPLFLLRQRLLDLESEGDMMALKVAVIQDEVCGNVHGGFNKDTKWGHTPQKEVSPQHYAAFMEKVILREIRLSAKRKRLTQKESRRINRV